MTRALLLALTLLALCAPAAAADTIVVNAGFGLDDPDKTNGTGVCETDTDNGECTLRAAIQTANQSPGKDTIAFGLDPIAARIKPRSPLPPLTEPVLIDGWTADGSDQATGRPSVELDGTGVPMPDPGSHGETITVKSPFGLDIRAAGSEVRGLAIHSFKSAQLALSFADSTLVQGNRIGLDSLGNAMGGAIIGIYVYQTIGATIGGSTAATRNVVSDNFNGIAVTGARSIGNLVHGNYVGSSADGLQVIGNLGTGILVTSNNAVGAADSTQVAGNLVVGHDSGIRVVAATDTQVFNNWVGLTATGLAKDAMGNSAGNAGGIDVLRAKNTLIGGGDEAWGNIVATSSEHGISVSGVATDTKVEGNIVGTDAEGVATVDWMGNPTGGAKAGIIVTQDAGGNSPRRTTIGGPRDVQGNLSSGNRSGVAILGGVEDVTVQQNRIGTDLPGLSALPNEIGIATAPDHHLDPPVNVRIGTPGAGNLVSGNSSAGVVVGERSEQVRVQGNSVGLAKDGKPLGNGNVGIVMTGDRHVVEENTVAHNRDGGIALADEATDVAVRANQVKLNRGPGIVLGTRNEIDFPARTKLERNFVTGNTGHGIDVTEDVADTLIEGNAVGDNDRAGVHVDAAKGVLMAANKIEDNREDGVWVQGETETIVVGWNHDEQPFGGCVERCNRIARNGGAGVSTERKHPVSVRGNQFVDNELMAIDIDGDGPDAIDPFDDDEVLNTPAGVHGTIDRKYDETAITGELAIGFDRDTKVDIYGLTDAPQAERARSGTFIGTAFPNERGHFVLRTQEPFASYMAVAVDDDGRTSESSLVCSAFEGSSDIDNDALCNDWEMDGIDYDADGKVDFKLPAAVASEPDLFVEVDWTKGAFMGDEPFSYLALHNVAQAFDAAPQPIWLHYEVGEEMDPVEGPLRVASRGEGDRDDLRDLRHGSDLRECDGYFGTREQRKERWCFASLGAKGLAYRYAVVTDRVDTGEAGGAAAGDALAIGVANWTTENYIQAGGGEGYCVTRRNCRAEVESSALMHELGHTLGLEHAGSNAVSPNYLSVMNAGLTFPFVLPGRPLDFSRSELPTLRESALNEPSGIGQSPASEWPGTVKIGYEPVSDTCVPIKIPVTGPVDWNGDGDATDEAVAQSVDEADADPVTGAQDCQPPQAPLQDIDGRDDWSHIQFDQRAVTYRYDDETQAAPGLGSDLMRLIDVMDTDDDGVPNGQDNCTRVANRDQADADDDRIGDACLPLIDERDVSLKLEADGEPVIGRPLTLTATLRNEYPLPATGLRVKLPVPEGWTLESSTGAYADGFWTVDSLPKRSEVSLDMKLVPGVEGVRPVVAELVTAGQPDPNSTPGNGSDVEDDRVALRLDPLPPEVTLGVRDARVQEGDRADVTARVRLTLPRSWPREVSVGWKTVAGTASTDDFAAGEGSVTFAAGEREALIEVPVRGDKLVEETERFTVALTVDGARLEREHATVTIVDDDAPAKPGELDYLGCVSEDRGPLTECLNTAPGMGEPLEVLAPDERFLYLVADESITVVEGRETRQCIATNRNREGCERLVPNWTSHVRAATFSPDGKFLYVLTRHANSGRATGLAVLARDAESGKLARVECYEGMSGCPDLAGVAGLDLVRGGRTELRADATELIAITDRPDAGRIVTFARGEDGRLSVPRCFDEGSVSQAPCVPLDASWGNDAEVAPFDRGWLVRSDAGLVALSKESLAPLPCAACGTFAGPGDVEVAPDAVYVTSEDRVTTLTPALAVTGCVGDAAAETGCEVAVEAAGGLRGLRLAPDGQDLYAGARGGGVVTLHRRAGGALTGGACVVAETATSRCGDGAPSRGGFALKAGEVWTAVDGVLARFVRFTVAPENRAPVCESGTAHTKPTVALGLTLRCADPDGDAVTIEVTRAPALGTLDRGRYVPNGARGEDTIAFRATDGRVWSPEAVIVVKVDDLAPVCESGRHALGVPAELELRFVCSDPEGGPVTLQLTPPGRGTLTGSTFRYAEKASAETAVVFTGTDEGGNVSVPARIDLSLTYVPPRPAPTPEPDRRNDRPPPNTTCRRNCTPDPRGNVPVTIVCDRNEANACTGEVRVCDVKGCRVIGKATAVLGRTSFKIQPGKSKTVKVKLNKQLRAKLKKQRKLAVRLEVTLRRPGAQPLVTSKRVTLRAPRTPARSKR